MFHGSVKDNYLQVKESAAQTVKGGGRETCGERRGWEANKAHMGFLGLLEDGRRSETETMHNHLYDFETGFYEFG